MLYLYNFKLFSNYMRLYSLMAGGLTALGRYGGNSRSLGGLLSPGNVAQRTCESRRNRNLKAIGLAFGANEDRRSCRTGLD